ncbi:MAG: hypothetical protein QOE60_1105 [Thermoleophilaceae bacterium]|jgi:hypothetical protein|nr:hypothetical protein [Thermoleophilaceae bacterium]
MTDGPGSSDFKPSTRGDAAWEEERAAIASRNADTRKVGKAERETYERERQQMMHAAAVKRQATVRGARSR